MIVTIKKIAEDRRTEADTSLRISDGKPVEPKDVKGGGTLPPCQNDTNNHTELHS